MLSVIVLANVPASATDAPHVTSIFPEEGPKQGGTKITVYGVGFEDSKYLQAKFTRRNPETDQIDDALSSCSYINSNEVTCESPSWDEATCPYCDTEIYGSTCPQDDNSCANAYPWEMKNTHTDTTYDGRIWGVGGQVHYHSESNHHHAAGMTSFKGRYPAPTGANEYHPTNNPNGQHPIGSRNDGTVTKFVGHTGSPFLRTNSLQTDTEISRGQFIKIRAQYFKVVRIERCATGEVGCFCDNVWSSASLSTNNSASTIDQYPIGQSRSYSNNAMYAYDANPNYWNKVNPPTCIGGNWQEGTKIVLSEAIYKTPGTPNVAFDTTEAYVSSMKPNVDCKGVDGCKLTMTLSNNGRAFSGSGSNGKMWKGSGAVWTAKYVVPVVSQVQVVGLSGKRDSTRIIVPQTGGTFLRVKGEGFQKSATLRCYFDQPRIMVKAEFIDSETIECSTVQFVARQNDLMASRLNDNTCYDHQTGIKFFAPDISDQTASNRLYDSTCTDSKQAGAAVIKVADDMPSADDNVFSGVDGQTEYESYSYTHVQVTNTGSKQDLSVISPRRADGQYRYVEDEGSLERSTCTQAQYPSTVVNPLWSGTNVEDSAVQPGHEQQDPCRLANQEGEPEGNDVQVKFGVCYDAQTAKSGYGSDYYGVDNGDSMMPNFTHSYGQTFQIDAEAQGPLHAVEIHLEKLKTSVSDPCHATSTCEQPSRRGTTLELCVSSGGFAGGVERIARSQQAGPTRHLDNLTNVDGAPRMFPTSDDYSFNTSGQILACSQFTVQSIKANSDRYTVYFAKAPYLLGFETYDTGNDAHYTNADQQSYYASGNNPQTSSAGSNTFAGVYYLTLSYVSGPATVAWKMGAQTSSASNATFSTNEILEQRVRGDGTSSDMQIRTSVRPAMWGNQNGYMFDWRNNATVPVGSPNTGFRAKFFTCDGCRWKYVSDADSDDSHQIGGIYGRQSHSEDYLKNYNAVACTSEMYTQDMIPASQAEDPSGAKGDECGTMTYREQYAQALRPSEDMTMTKMKTKMRAAYSSTDPYDPNWSSSPGSDNTVDHDTRTASGDFNSAQGATVSTWITKYGKMGEHVCRTFTGITRRGYFQLQGDASLNTDSAYEDNYQAQTLHNPSADDTLIGCGLHNKKCLHCDLAGNGTFNELCHLGARCDRNRLDVFGGCGPNAVCALAEVVTNGHYQRASPAGSGPTSSRCGHDADCSNTQGLKVSHSIKLEQATSATDWKDVVWEFEKPVVLNKHTTYYVNMAVDETISNSDSVYWAGGTQRPLHCGPGMNCADKDKHEFSRSQFLSAYKRVNVVVNNQMVFTWLKINDPTGDPFYFNLEIQRCVTALPSIESISASGAGTDTCLTRSSPKGGAKGPTLTVTGKNFFASSNLAMSFLNADGSKGPVVPCVATKYDYTEMECPTPTFDPHADIDCTVEGHCTGTHMMVTNDGENWGGELFKPKYNEAYDTCVAYKSVTGTCAAATPLSINGSHHDFDHHVQQLFENTLMHCFTDLHVSLDGDDYRGDGTMRHPFMTIQVAIDAANAVDRIVLHPGTYTGVGNRGIRHGNKQIEVVTVESAAVDINYHNQNSFRDVTQIDCEHSADGFVINNGVDGGFIDFSDITTMNCENMRILY